jgi:hypothetical protein
LNRDFAVQQQLHYEKKLCRQLLDAVTSDASRVRQLVSRAQADFGFNWVFDHFGDCPIRLGSRRVQYPLQAGNLMGGKIKKESWYTSYLEVKDDYDHRQIGLVFDHHGDGLGDVVVHNASYLINVTHPHIVLPPNDHHSEELIIQSWPVFLLRLAERYQPE